MLQTIINIISLVTAVLIIACVLIQNRGAGLSAAFGGDAESFYARRGFDRFLFISTIILGIVFAGSILAQSIIP